MTADEYLKQLLLRYSVPSGPGSGVMTALGDIVPRLKTWANKYLNTIGPSGSFAKGTTILGATDLDIFISIRNDAPQNLQQVYESLFRFSENELWFPKRQNVSIGITWLGTKVDLVLGKRQANLTTDHSLWRNKQQTWTQTNVTTHIACVQNSGRAAEIRLLKIWRQCHSLDFPSFYMELTVIDALRGKSYGTLGNNLSAVFEYLRDDFESAPVIDPANSNNYISDDLTALQKKAIAKAAADSRMTKYWKDVLW